MKQLPNQPTRENNKVIVSSVVVTFLFKKNRTNLREDRRQKKQRKEGRKDRQTYRQTDGQTDRKRKIASRFLWVGRKSLTPQLFSVLVCIFFPFLLSLLTK